MNCCSTDQYAGTNKFFSRWSRKYAKSFRRKGLEKVQRHLLEGIEREPITSKEILDIGCGVGGLHLTLLENGAARAVGIDLAEGMLQQARVIAKERGLEEKTTYVQGDFVARADALPDADITLLDKVVCCYEDLASLIYHSTRKTRQLYGIIHPRNAPVPRWIFKAQILFSRLFCMQFRPYWHDWQQMNEMIRGGGFRLLYERPAILWNVAVFERVRS
ncbi:MAG: methyltransferase domain-containing protein [Ignavibacteriales bacterium]|nr:methyltransferase domain-containing protein [Ignavibacteriales bacterium]